MVQPADPSAANATMMGYSDPFAIASGVQGISGNHVTASLNPYAQDASALAGTAYYQNAPAFAQPVSPCSDDAKQLIAGLNKASGAIS